MTSQVTSQISAHHRQPSHADLGLCAFCTVLTGHFANLTLAGCCRVRRLSRQWPARGPRRPRRPHAEHALSGGGYHGNAGDRDEIMAGGSPVQRVHGERGPVGAAFSRFVPRPAAPLSPPRSLARTGARRHRLLPVPRGAQPRPRTSRASRIGMATACSGCRSTCIWTSNCRSTGS